MDSIPYIGIFLFLIKILFFEKQRKGDKIGNWISKNAPA
jgi:hypothetical protein